VSVSVPRHPPYRETTTKRRHEIGGAGPVGRWRLGSVRILTVGRDRPVLSLLRLYGLHQVDTHFQAQPAMKSPGRGDRG
jgi:hypothetical protein